MRLTAGIATFVSCALLSCLTGCGDSSDRQVIQNKGSDTLFNVAQAWAENYKKVDSEVAVVVSGGGSGTGIAALMNGTVDIANASRKIKDSEMEAAKAGGNDPQEFIVGWDALAVYVHKDNPLEEISIETLAKIFGEGGDLDDWSQLGVTIPGAKDTKIVRVSRQNNSGTYAYFRDAILGKKRDFKSGSRDMHGSKDVVEFCKDVHTAIGYSGIAYANDHVKMLKIVGKDGKAVAPTTETAVDRTYPIARPLLMYTAKKPEGKIKAYMDWILSDDGQRIIQEMKYAPIRKLD